jgi:flagellar hook-associated protein 2
MQSLSDKLLQASLSTFSNPKIATSSNTAIATVTANSNAVNSTHALEVNELARSSTLTSSAPITVGADRSSLNTQLGLGMAAGDTATITLTQGGKSAEIEISHTDTIFDLVQKINNARTPSPTPGLSPGDPGYEPGEALGIRANYDQNLDRFFISSTESGEASNFTLAATNPTGGANILDRLNIGAVDGFVDTEASIHSAGRDSVIRLNGVEFKNSSNDFTIAGMSFSLKQTTEPGSHITIGVRTDNSKIVSNLRDLVESYNKLLELITGKTTERYNRDFGPLTDDQKKEMTEREIELWEERAKSGILRNDSILTGLATKMRVGMYSAYNIDGKFNTLGSLGISTAHHQDRGKLTIDEEKLMRALEEDPDAIAKLFAGPDGLVAKIREDIRHASRQMEHKGGVGRTVDTESSWARELRRYDAQLDAMQKKMKVEENRYFMQFANMERLLGNMNSSSGFLMSMFGS